MQFGPAGSPLIPRKIRKSVFVLQVSDFRMLRPKVRNCVREKTHTEKPVHLLSTESAFFYSLRGNFGVQAKLIKLT